jgi:thiol-disulfide isomerase/thioredoxin
MSTRRLLLLELVLVAGVVAGIYAWRMAPLLPTDGAPVPPYALPDLAGEVRSQDALAGRAAVLYFFAPWCAVCNASAHQLRWFEQWKGDEVELVLIALDYESPAAVAEYGRRHALDTPILLGDRQTAERFNVYGFPTYYVVDATGRLVSRDFGYSTVAGLWLRTRLASRR